MKIKHDETLSLAVGMGRKSRIWKNKKWKWSRLVAKLKEENKTLETFKEYSAASREDRSKIKDVGGYVGGYLRNGRRKPENVVHRQIMTLDIDYAHLDFWDDFTLQFGNAAVLHATHSHSEEDPRYRLIMPLSREVSPDEYVAIARAVAGTLDIELFDTTTFETNRLMYWPSVSKDVDYYFQFQDGEFVDADEILGSYEDWTDSTLWPTSERQKSNVLKLTKKQEDPELKKGMVGAFVKTYSIDEAIEKFLKDQYVSCGDDRYTYLLGNTSAGLITYEGKFAYSHHGSDPTSLRLCNAFDLVRIHLFGELDSGESDKSSFKAMENFCRQDPGVKKTIATEKLLEAKNVFSEELEPLDLENLEWTEELDIDARGKYTSSANNLNVILANDPRLKALLKLNLFDNKRYIYGSMPWRSIKKPEPIKNVDYAGIRNYLETVYGIVGTSKIDDAVSLEFEKRSFHPVKDYLTSLEWDNVSRVDTLLIDYFGADDDIYTREAIRKTLCASVARIFKPGTKFDLVLTLVGDQGTGKSTLAHKLGGVWFSDSFMTVHGKDAFEQLQGAWIIEMAELSGLRKAEVEAVKHFISKQEDTFRPAYARVAETFPRQCVFIGTTNNKDFLNDPSGNRRFMPIDIQPLKATKDIFQMDQDDVDQIWAEAVIMYKSGEKLYLSDQAESIARVEQKKHSAEDERGGYVEEYLNLPLPADWDKRDLYARQLYVEEADRSAEGYERDHVCVAEVWCELFKRPRSEMNRYNTREINQILKSLEGWSAEKSARNFPIYGKQRCYSRDLH